MAKKKNKYTEKIKLKKPVTMQQAFKGLFKNDPPRWDPDEKSTRSKP